MTIIDKNINLNLKIVYAGDNHSVFIIKLTNVDGDFLGDFDGKRMADKLVDEGLITRVEELCEITRQGIIVSEAGGWEEFKKLEKKAIDNDFKENEFRSDLELENLRLQNENLVFEQSIRKSNEKIDRLNIKNLKLQNKQLKYYSLFSIIGFILGGIVSNIELIIKLFK